MPTKKSTASLPLWWQEIHKKFRAKIAHTFLLYGNVRDYIVAGVTLDRFITSMLLAMKPSVLTVQYSVANGFVFQNQAAEDLFRALSDMEKAEGEDNMASAMRSEINAGPPPLPQAPLAALLLIRKALQKTSSENGLAVIIEDVLWLAPDNEPSRMSSEERKITSTMVEIARDPMISAAGNLVFFTCEVLSDVSPALRSASSRIEQVQVGMPIYDQRLAFINKQKESESNTQWRISPEVFASMSAALSLYNIEDVVQRGEIDGYIDETTIENRKREIVSNEYNDVLVMERAKAGLDSIGGLRHAKKLFTETIINPIKKGQRDIIPQGILLVGPPGTGKSALARAISYESGLNFARLDLSKIYDKFLGNSEKNLERLFLALSALEPVILFIDEVDQAFQRGQTGDTGASNRQFSRIMEFMADTNHRGQIITLAASNRPDLMDAALRRPGRFDIKVLIPSPSEEDRKEIIAILASKYLKQTVEVTSGILSLCEKWTGAELEMAMTKAARLLGSGEVKDAGKAVVEAFTRVRPSTADIQLMTLLALKECNDADYVPEEWRHYLDERSQLDIEIEKLRRLGGS